MRGGTFRESLALLTSRRFGTFWFASLLSSIGTWAQQVAEPWLLLSLGASPFLVGLDSFAMSAPVWLLTLLGGVLADRADRRTIIAGFQSAQMLCPLIIVVLLLTHSAQPWMIIVLSVVVGITDALSMPSFSSIVPSIVERKQIGAGLALNSTQFNISRVAGPAIAGVLMATIGAVGCFALSAASYVPFIGVALWILPPRPRHEGPREALTLRSTFQGLGTVFAAPLLRGALLTAGFSGLLCGPLITFVPVLVRDLLHGGASQYSLSVAAFGVGGVAGALGLLALGPAHDRRRIATVTAMIYAATLLLCAVTPVFWALPVVLVLGGMAMSITNTLTNTLIQSSAAPELRGQAVSLYMIAMRGGIALGSLVTGGLVGLWGVRTTLVANGVLALVAQALVARRWLQGPATVS